MKKNIAVIDTMPQKSCIASREKLHLADILIPSLCSLLFLFASGIFLFSCDDTVKPSSEATITSLALTVGDTDYPVMFTGKQGTFTVPYSTRLPADAKVKKVVLSAKATGVKVGETLPISVSGMATLTVTAEDGKTKGVYTITVKKAPPRSEASITDLTLTVGDTNYEITFEDTQGSVMLSYGTAIPAMVGVASVELSPGATSVVQGNDLTVINNAVTFTVTSEDGTTEKTYTVTLSVGANDEASLTSLSLSVVGRDYDVTFADTQGSVTLPYGTVIPAMVSVASVQLSAGATGAVMGNDFTVTDNTITITVTAEDGTTTQEYTVTLSVVSNNDILLTSLKLSVAGSDYDATFTDTQGSVIVSYGTVIPATVSVASVALSDGATGIVQGNDLTVTNNAVTITVTAADGITTKTYTVTLSVGANNEAGITTLKLSISGSDYDITFTDTQGSMTLPYGTAIPATVAVTSVQLSDGATGVVQGNDLTVTNNAVTITVTAADGITTQTYTVTLSVGANDEAGITSLQLSVAGSDYDVTFTDTQGSVIVSYGTVIPATVAVTSVQLSDGATGVVMGNDLTVTNNAVTITVTAADGITTQTYTVTLSVGANDEAGITSLKLSVSGTSYDATFTDTQGSVIVSYGTVIPATVGVASVALSDGATGVVMGDDLTVTNNAVTITVTAADGITTQTYTVTLSVGANDEAGITSLKLSVAGSDYDVTFTDTQGSVIVSYGTTIPATVGVTSVALSDGATGVVMGDDLTVTNNAVTITVTAADGITTKTYTVTLSVGANDEAGITTLQLSVAGSDYDITFTDTQGSVIVSYGTAIPATVAVTSVQLSDGATGVVMGNDLTVTNNAVTITVTAEDGETTQTYTVTLSVGANDEAGITSLKLSVAGSDYDITFTDTQGSMTLPYGTAIPATVGVTSVQLSDGATGVVMGNDLTVTNNAVTITVTAADGETTQTYTVTLSVGANDEAGITSLKLSVSGSDYDITFTDTQGSMTLPYGTAIPATVGVTSVALSDGATGVVMGDDLTVTNNAVTITVTAEDGITTKTYTVTLSVGANNEAGITTLQLSVAGSDYDITFTATQGNVIVPYGTAIPATVDVTSVQLSDGATGVVMGDDLTVTNNAVTITVTAEDGETTQTYTVTLSVGANDEAGITTLQLSVAGSDYDVTFTDTQGSVIVSYGTTIPATVGVTSVALSDGATGVVMGDDLTVTNNAVTLTVTAADGITTKTYTVTLSVGANDEAGITTLQLSVSGSDYDITFTDTQGSMTLPYGTAIPATVGVTSVALSDGATGVVQGNDLTVTNNAVTITVTAEDGETTQTYTVTLSVGANNEAGITTLKLSVAGSDYDITFTDTQGSMTLPYGTAIPATVGVTSVQLSDGATGVVQGNDLTVTNNAVTITVTAADGTTTQTYTVTLSVGANNEAGITTLQLSVSGSDYDITFTDTQGSMTLPYGTVIPATVGVTSVALSDGATGVVMGDDLTVTNNAVTLTVTAADGTTTQTYTVTLSVGANNEAGITTLQLSVAGSDYDITFTATQGNVIVPYGTAIPATVGVTSVALSDGATGVVQGAQLNVVEDKVTLTVTAADGITTQTYTVTLSVGANDEAGITTLQLSVAGSAYDITFVDTQGSVIVPYGTAIPATVSVTSVALSDGATGVEQGNDLPVTNNAVTLTVTAADGITTQTYTVTLSVGANDEAGITTLQLSVAGSAYDITFVDTQGSVIVPYGTAIPATVSVTSVALSDGATGVEQGNDLPVTNNAVTITVTAEDGETEQTYTVTLSVGANDEAGITTLQLSVAGSDYDITFENTQGSVIVPYGTVIPATVGVASVALSDGATGVVMGDDLTVTNNAVTITVTAADGITTKTYTVTLSVGANDEAGITSLKLSVSGSDYDVIFVDTQGSVIVPYGTAIPATVGVTLVALSDGATGVEQGDDLTVTNNAVTLTVTAEDGITTQTYTVTLSVGANDEAGITSLQLSVAGSDYDVTFTDTQGSVIVPYGTAIPATVGVASVALSDGATGVEQGNDLPVTNNAVTITVTAEDGTTEKTYTVTLSVGANDDASITDLTLTVAGTDYIVTFTDRQDTLRVVPYGTAIPATVSVTSVQLSDGATGVVQGSQLTVTNNVVTLTVMAEDGTTTQEYTVMLGFTTVGITSFTFEVADNEGMALDAADRQQIVGMINQETKTITFAQQSAYVYRDKLKATLGLSEPGVTVQVQGMTQESGVTEQDFRSPVSYVVYVQGGTETTYTVTTLTKSTRATIPDDNFRAKLKAFVPAAFTGDQLNIMHSDVINYTIMKVESNSIVSLKGLEFFTALKNLNSFDNPISSLDVRKNTALVFLGCSDNLLTSLDVSKNTALEDLYCRGNNLTSLDLSKNTALTLLFCFNNSLTSLDMTGMRSVIDLNIGTGGIGNNPLATLRVNTALQNHTKIVSMKTARGTDLTITTVNNDGDVVCNDYIPAENGGNCN